jgi:hypothetical protein
MEKLVYLLFQSPSVPGAELREGLIHKAAPQLRAAGATRLAVNVCDEAVAMGSGVRIRKSDPPIQAMVSFWLENSDDRAPCERALEPHAARLSGYLVVESLPIVNTKHRAPAGQRTPGVNMVSCVTKKRSLSYEQFFDIWLNDQRRVAIETQSTFGYKRNFVVRGLTAPTRAWDAIVEESFPLEALTDPWVWYAADSKQTYEANLKRMLDNVGRFLDNEPLESTPMSEYLLD